MRWSSSVAGSSHSPVWTSDGWIIVLDGETSQWNRSAWPSRAIGPASGSPAAIRSMALEMRPDRGRIEVRGERREPALVEGDPGLEVAPRATQQDDPDVEALAALDARQQPHDRVLEGVTRRLGHGPPPRRSRAALRAAG